MVAIAPEHALSDLPDLVLIFDEQHRLGSMERGRRRHDGRLDVVINDLDGSPQVLHNEMTNVGNWLIVRLKGRAPNTGAIGALVTARNGSVAQQRLVQSGSSYISQEDKRLHFGLGKATQVDSLEVKWPDGTTTKMENVKAAQIVAVVQR